MAFYVMRQIKITNNFHATREDSVSAYFKDVRNTCKHLEDKPDELQTPEELVKSHLKFAISVAKKYIHNGISFEDLIQYANMALLYAARKFDPTKGFQFTSYCVFAIRMFIIDQLRLNKIGVKDNSHIRKELNMLRELKDKKSQEDEHFYTFDELKNMYPDLISDLTLKLIQSDNIIHNEDCDIELFNDYPDIEDKIIDEDRSYRIKTILKKLNEKQQYIINALFFENKTMYMIAQELNCTVENVRVHRDRAYLTIKRYKKFLLQ